MTSMILLTVVENQKTKVLNDTPGKQAEIQNEGQTNI